MRMTYKSARVNAGLTQQEAADILGVSVVTLSKWENYITSPNVNKAHELANLYGVSIDNLIFSQSN